MVSANLCPVRGYQRSNPRDAWEGGFKTKAWQNGGQTLTAILAVAAIVAPPAQAQEYAYKELYKSAGAPRASNPNGLVRDSDGNFFGTGGGGACGLGSVFRMTPTGTVTVLYSFTGLADGGSPVSPLVRDQRGNIYGATSGRGTSTCPFNEPCGVVFKLDATGTETVLHTFTGGADGAIPYAGLVRDSEGNLYGTTFQGVPPGEGLCSR